MLNNFRLFSLLFLFGLSVSFLYPQTKTVAESEAESSSQYIYIIESYEYVIRGMTKPRAMDNFLDTKDPPEFSDFESMLAYSLNLKQDLINLRIFETVETALLYSADNSEDELPPGSQGKGAVKRYTLRISVKDGWTFFPLLVPVFDSNDNVSLQLKINYANLFGTLIDFSIDGDFGIGVEPGTENLGLNFWNVETGFSNINRGNKSFSFSWKQAFARNIKKDGIEIIEYYTFNKSDFHIATKFDLGFDYYYEIAPTVELSYNYHDKSGMGESYIDQEPRSYGIYQKGGRDQINWIGNFQEGLHWETQVISRFVPGSGFKGQWLLSNRWFTALNTNLSYGSRVLAFTAINDEIYGLGEYMRGIPDFNISGKQGLFINNSLAVRIFDWENVMEFQLQPFSDMGILSPVDRGFAPEKDLRMTLGCDFLIFPEKLTSANLRITLGFDLFGPGYLSDRYEILLSTSLFF